MEGTSDLGVFAPILAAIPEDWRGLAVSVIGILLLFGAFWNLLKSPFEAMLALWRALKSLFGRLLQKRRIASDDTVTPEPIPEEKTIWETLPVTAMVVPQAVSRQGIPIITIANMKGGVGKTTITANLATVLQAKLHKPILVIDFDYQGSLSDMLWRQAGHSDRPELRAHSLLMGNLDVQQVQAHARPLANGLERVDLYPSGYPLATVENEIMIKWVKAETQDDVRFRLGRILRSEYFQSRYAAVLIDCPPRITTGTINALCASTHLLIPTKLDEMSAEAVVYFLKQIDRMKDMLFPNLSLIGVVPSMTSEVDRLSDYEQRGRDRLHLYLAGRTDLQVGGDPLMIDQRVPQRAEIARPAGVGVAYLRRASIRPIFDRLGAEVLRRLQ